MTHLYSHENQYDNVDAEKENGAWARVADESFLFFDGTSNEPMPRRDVYDANYLGQGVQIAGLILAGVACMFVVGTGIWVFANRQHKLIKAGQPEFPYLLCFGAALVASSSIFVSFDESDGLTVDQLSGMCSTFPWFFINGYLIMYCALVCKLWRPSKLMQMRRKAVLAKQVMLPFLMIMGHHPDCVASHGPGKMGQGGNQRKGTTVRNIWRVQQRQVWNDSIFGPHYFIDEYRCDGHGSVFIQAPTCSVRIIRIQLDFWVYLLAHSNVVDRCTRLVYYERDFERCLLRHDYDSNVYIFRKFSCICDRTKNVQCCKGSIFWW